MDWKKDKLLRNCRFRNRAMDTEELEIDALTQKEIAWTLKYCSEDIGHAMHRLWGHWWGKRRKSKCWMEKGERYWKSVWDRTVRQIQGETEMRARSRCPHCGVKLTARRCLACHLRLGVINK